MNQRNPFDNELSAAESRIARHLRAQAPTVALQDTPVGDVVCRGQRRRTRRRTTIGVAAVAAVSAGTIAGIGVLSRPDHAAISDAPSSVDSTGGTNTTMVTTTVAPGSSAQPAVLTASNLVWNPVVPLSANAVGSAAFGVTQSSAPFIAVSSAPGKSSTSDDGSWKAALYSSTDGIVWNQLTGVPEMPLSSIDAYDGSIYAFSTAAATAAIPDGGAGDVVVQASHDGGATWDAEILPIDLRALADQPGVGGTPFNWRYVSAGPNGVLAAGEVALQLDLHETGLAEPGEVVVLTDNGVTVYPADCFGGTATTVASPATSIPGSALPCEPDTLDTTQRELAARSYTWAELGLDTELTTSIVNKPLAFYKPNGSDAFVQVASPELADGEKFQASAMYATQDGFVLTGSINQGMSQTSVMFITTDGSSWTRVHPPMAWQTSFGQLADGTYVAVGMDADSSLISATSPDAVNWTATNLGALLTPDDGASATFQDWRPTIGAAGITIAAAIAVDPFIENGPVSVTRDGVVASMINQKGEIVFTDEATGDELGRMASESGDVNVRFDNEGTMELLNPDGSVRLTFTGEDQGELYNQSNGRFPQNAVLLHSTDGVNWSREDLSDTAGFEVLQATRLASVDNKVLVTMLDVNTKNADGTPRVVVLVGTPKS